MNKKPRALSLPVALSPEANLRRYLQEIAKFPLLEQKEEYTLAKRWREHGDIEAAHRLVTSHLRLVAKIATRYRGYGLPAGELIAEGNIGLMQAVKRFDPDRGFRLATYAIWWIKASMQEYVLKSWSLVKIGSSAAQKKLFFNLRKIKRRLGILHHGELPPESSREIARTLDVSEQEVIDMNRRLSGGDVSLHQPVGPEGEEEKIAFLVEPSQSQETMLSEFQDSRIRHDRLAQAMQLLNDRERDILTQRRLSEPAATLDDLSKIYGISRERVRQIEVRAFEKLQKEMRA